MYFAGLDAHLKYVTVAVLDRLGALVLETTVPTREPERLLAVLAPFRPLEVVVETRPGLALVLRFVGAGRDRPSSENGARPTRWIRSRSPRKRSDHSYRGAGGAATGCLCRAQPHVVPVRAPVLRDGGSAR